jgi:hypothetical protein
MKPRSLMLWGCLFTGASLILAAGCSTTVRHKRNLVCLIDYSGSMNDQIVKGYMKVIENDVLANIGEHDRLVVLPIDGASKTRASKICYLDMEGKSFAQPNDGFAHARDSVKSRINAYMHTVSADIMHEIMRQRQARKKFSNYSDIFSSLFQAGQFVQSDPPRPSQSSASGFLSGATYVSDNAILIFSDMIHESAEFTFATPRGCPPEKVAPILSTLRKRAVLPELSGCKVFVYGRTGKSNLEVENTEHFWEAYFRATHGELAAYDYETDNVIATYMMLPH